MKEIERQWKLGEDLCLTDDLLDPITFEEVALTCKCNCREVTRESVCAEIQTILEMRMEDMKALLERNIDEIIEEVKRRK